MCKEKDNFGSEKALKLYLPERSENSFFSFAKGLLV